MSDNEVDIKTDVALIKKDIKQIERFFVKFDSALESMHDMSEKTAVHAEILKNAVTNINDLDKRLANHQTEESNRTKAVHQRLEEYRKSAYDDHRRLSEASTQNREERNKEIMDQLSKMNGKLEIRLTKLDDRIKLLEQWKWYIMGLGAVAVFVATNFPWDRFF